MDVPKSTLLAARRWLSELAHRDVQGAWFVLRSAPNYRDLTPTQYDSAYEWLRVRKLLDENGRLTNEYLDPGVQVLRELLSESEPIWLSDADSLIADATELPLDVIAIGAAVGISEDAVFEEVQRAWRKFDDAAQRALGSAGEAAMIEWLSEHSTAEVLHVSSFDDAAGYDIALRVGGTTKARIEVKATRRLDAVLIYLSRNEFQTMLRHSSWALQVVTLDLAGGIRSLGWLPSQTIVEWAPADQSLGVWQSMKLVLPTSSLRDGPAPVVGALIS